MTWPYRQQGSYVPKALQTQDELVPLVQDAQSGDTRAMDELAWRMWPLVRSITYRHRAPQHQGNWGHGRYVNSGFDEIGQAAWLGLAEAVQRYSPDHPAGKDFWLVAYYRIVEAVKLWQAAHSGALPLPKTAWQQASALDTALEKAGVVMWEDVSDERLREVTGHPNAGAILRARLVGITLHPQDSDTRYKEPSAEADFWEAQEDAASVALVQWLVDLEDIPQEHWEDATVWKLEQVGMADEVEAAALLERRPEIMRAVTRRRGEA